jgi:hypothetical protein
VHAVAPGSEGAVHRSFLVFADGLALYREARHTVDPVDLPVPIYRTVAAYRLDPRTTRTLARELQRAGLFQPGAPTDLNRPRFGDEASVAWWAQGMSGYATRRQLDRGPLERALVICDAYLPASRRFGSEQPAVVHVEEVPEPIEDLDGALGVHLDVVQDREVDADFLREVFALALNAGAFAIAADALREIVELGPVGASGEPLPVEDWNRFEIEPMRAALRAAGVL